MSVECPKCGHDLNNAISRYFWGNVGCIDPAEFEYECPNCETKMRVEVEAIPWFHIYPIQDMKVKNE
jgi:hypothetical protein